MLSHQKKGIIDLSWYISNSCNLRCKHCYNSEFDKEINLDYNQISLEKKIIRDIIELNEKWDLLSIKFLGGEPLLHPKIFDYIKVLKETVDCPIGIATNSLLIDDEVIRNIKKFNIVIQISMESNIEEIHDLYRGKGTYQRTLKIIQKLIENKIYPSLRMTISRINLSNMKQFALFFKNLGVKNVSFNKYIPDEYNSNELQALTKLEHSIFINTIFEMKKEYGENFIITEDPCYNDYYKDEMFKIGLDRIKNNLPIGGCSAGLMNIIIRNDGKIYPCTLLPIEIGNIKENSIIEIWERDNNIMDQLRNRANFLKGNCKTCENKLICGGCRAAAFKVKKDFLEEDPFCSKFLIN